MKIFIVEDERAICNELSVLLQKYGYSFESSTDFAHMTEHMLEVEPYLVLLDINLPFQDGYMICCEIRKQSDIPSVGNNDRGTFIVPDHIAISLMKDANILLVQYKH